jgi:mannose-6-phosphate isomerase-like protein (cupin superfamily)
VTAPTPTTTTITGNSTTSCVVLAPDGGERLRFLDASTMRLKLAGAANAEVAVYEYVSEPGAAGPPQHIHQGHDETFYVVAGTYQFTIGTDVHALPTGGFLHVPRGTPHTFRNCGTGTGRIVGTFNPPRFADYFRELALIIEATGGAPDRATWAELYARYDTTFYEPPDLASGDRFDR